MVLTINYDGTGIVAYADGLAGKMIMSSSPHFQRNE